jgi:hypothetical protein
LYYGKGKSIGIHVHTRTIDRSPLTEDQTKHNGLVYWKFQIATHTQSLVLSNIVDFAVMLQKIGCDTQGVYAVISKNWLIEMFGESSNDNYFLEQREATQEENLLEENQGRSVHSAQWI